MVTTWPSTCFPRSTRPTPRRRRRLRDQQGGEQGRGPGRGRRPGRGDRPGDPAARRAPRAAVDRGEPARAHDGRGRCRRVQRRAAVTSCSSPRTPTPRLGACASAIAARAGVNVAVLVTDTAGRPGARVRPTSRSARPGSASLDDHAGRVDPYGNTLEVTAPAVADELAGRRRARGRQARPAPVRRDARAGRPRAARRRRRPRRGRLVAGAREPTCSGWDPARRSWPPSARRRGRPCRRSARPWTPRRWPGS